MLRYTLRIDRRMFAKFRYVSDFEGRSANKEIEQMLKNEYKNLKVLTEKYYLKVILKIIAICRNYYILF